MRKILLIVIPFMLSILPFCSQEGESVSIRNAVENTVSSGTWKIVNFLNNDTLRTANFTGYNFTFGANDILVAANGTNIYLGTWIVLNDSGNDDSLDDLYFKLIFAFPAEFEELNDDWDIVSRTADKIELKHVRDGGVDLLTFDKN